MSKNDFQVPLLLAALVTVSLLSSIALAEPNIGSAAAVKNRVEGVSHEQTRTLSAGSAVYSRELIRSGEASIAELVFQDSTKLSVGPKSEVRLDKFVYDPDKGAGKVAIKAGRGAFRFVTGTQDPRDYEIKTPYATLGVRGTVLEIVVVPGKGRAGSHRASRRSSTRVARQ